MFVVAQSTPMSTPVKDNRHAVHFQRRPSQSEHSTPSRAQRMSSDPRISPTLRDQTGRRHTQSHTQGLLPSWTRLSPKQVRTNEE